MNFDLTTERRYSLVVMYGLLEVLLFAVVFRDATAPHCPISLRVCGVLCRNLDLAGSETLRARTTFDILTCDSKRGASCIKPSSPSSAIYPTCSTFPSSGPEPRNHEDRIVDQDDCRVSSRFSLDLAPLCCNVQPCIELTSMCASLVEVVSSSAALCSSTT